MRCARPLLGDRATTHAYAPIRMLSPFLALPAHFTRTRVPTRGSYLVCTHLLFLIGQIIRPVFGSPPQANRGDPMQDVFFFYHPPSTSSMGKSKGNSASKAKQPAITRLARPLIKVGQGDRRADRRES